MNIIKLQDKIIPESYEKSNFFNTYLKGKYAYWIRMRYIVPFDTMTHDGYVACEEDINKLLIDSNGEYPRPFGCEYLDLYEHIVDLYDDRELNILDYIDTAETDRINNINEYIIKNSFNTDKDITLDEIKKFRTWLASELLLFDTNYKTGEYINNLYTSQEIHVLKYYKQGMIDETINSLVCFGNPLVKYNETKTSSCGCSGSSDLSSLYNTNLSTCDPINIYKKNIHNKMVEMFSNIDFWTQTPKEFILTFKQYIDNIISVGLPINNGQHTSKYLDCVCSKGDQSQQENIIILKKLSESLNYIYNNDLVGHKNYISDALKSWAFSLYEQMEW
jgi:hypothetical protein